MSPTNAMGIHVRGYSLHFSFKNVVISTQVALGYGRNQCSNPENPISSEAETVHACINATDAR